MIKKSSQKRKVLEQREKKFNLDCNNPAKSKMAEYNPLKDKYMKYMIPSAVISYVKKQSERKLVSKVEFQQFLQSHKLKITKGKQNLDSSIIMNKTQITQSKQQQDNKY